MSGFSFYAAVIGFCLGVLGAVFFAFGLVEVVWFLVLSLCVGLVWRRGGGRMAATPTPLILAFSVLLLATALGITCVEVGSWFTGQSDLEQQVNQKVVIEGTIVREPDIRASTQHLYVKVEDETVLVTTDRYGRYKYGDRVGVTGELAKPQVFETDLGRTFNYPGYLKAQGVNYLVRYAKVEYKSGGHGNWLVGSLLQFKLHFMNSIEAVIAEPAVSLGEGLLLGVKQALGDKWEAVFRKTGIIHIVVLSGYNVSLVVIFVMYVLSYLLPYRIRLLVGVVAIICFALLVGLSATVVRASLMAAFILLARFTGRTYTIMRGLMLAGLAMLLINPYLLPYDVGFQLSFLATMGLLLLAPHIDRLVSFVPAIFGREFLVATVATQIFVMPLLLYQIGQFSVVSVMVNVLVLPMVSVAMFLTFITGLLGFLSNTLALPVAYLAQLSLNYILVVAEWFANLPFAAYNVPAFSFWWVPLSYLPLALVLWRISQPTAIFSKQSSGWTIEEEADLKARLKSESKDEEKPIPVFFS